MFVYKIENVDNFLAISKCNDKILTCVFSIFTEALHTWELCATGKYMSFQQRPFNIDLKTKYNVTTMKNVQFDY